MTHHPIRILEDGTRVYSSYNRYKPKPLEERVNGINKPDDPRAVRFHAVWFVPMDLAPDDERVMPETRPDDQAYDHMGFRLLCRCDVCQRPWAERWRRKWRKDQGLAPGPAKKISS